jgi:hypothetical protein
MTKQTKRQLPKIQKRTGTYIFGSIVGLTVVVGIATVVSNQVFSTQKSATPADYTSRVLGTSKISETHHLTINKVTQEKVDTTPAG